MIPRDLIFWIGALTPFARRLLAVLCGVLLVASCASRLWPLGGGETKPYSELSTRNVRNAR